MSKEQPLQEQLVQEYKELRYPRGPVYSDIYDYHADKRYTAVVREMERLVREPVGLELGRVRVEKRLDEGLGYHEEKSYYLLKHKHSGELFTQHETEIGYQLGIFTNQEKKQTTVYLSAEPWGKEVLKATNEPTKGL
jgi:hypothetical protein